MADENNNGWGGRTPSPRREESGRDSYGQSGDNNGASEQPRNGGHDAEANPGNNLHVSGLALRTTDQDLEEIFGKFGKISKAQVMKDPHSRESRGFGFVNFEQNEDANAAMAALNGTSLDDRTIGVEKARRGRARTPTPGQYHGPAKVRPAPYGRPFEGGRRDDRFGGPPPRRFDDRRGPPPPFGSMAAQPMRGGPDDRRGGYGYDDRRPAYDDRRGGGGYDDRRGGFDDRRYDDRRVDSRYDDRRGGAPFDQGRRERDYDDRRRDYRDEPPRRY